MLLDDIPWLVDEWRRGLNQEARNEKPRTASRVLRSDLVARLLDELYRRTLATDQAQARAQIPRDLLGRIDAQTQRNDQYEQERTRMEAKRKRVAAAKRTRTAKQLQLRIAQIESGDDRNAMIGAWKLLGDEQGTRRARRDITHLAETVGEELVPVFLRGLKSYWRKNAVAIPNPSSNTILSSDMAGLTGLTLEIDDGLDLRSLSPEEARLAAIYAFHELNVFPFWFEDLVASQPAVVEGVMREVISRIWLASDEKPTLLAFGSYTAKPVAALMRTIVLDLAESSAPASRQTLEDAIDTLLTSGEGRPRVLNIANKGLAIDSAHDARLSQWLRLLAHVDPLAAADRVESLRITDVARYKQILETLANLLQHDLSDRRVTSIVTAMKSPHALGAWLRLLLLGISPEQDIEYPRGKAHFEGARDRAQAFRDRCLSRLRENTTEAAHDVLTTLAADPTLASYRWAILPAIEFQLQVARDAVARAWSEDEILAVERRDERQPQTLDDLLALVRSHIAYIDRLISNDDFSYRDVFDATHKKIHEREIQLWAASNLQERARGLYSVVRENAVDDDKEVDISALASVGQVPIEIKPLGPYSFSALQKVIVDQLLGQYMQPPERRCGVLLLVRRERERWRIHNRWGDLHELRSALQKHAREISQQYGKTIVVEVIDLLAKSGSSSHRADVGPGGRRALTSQPDAARGATRIRI